MLLVGVGIHSDIIEIYNDEFVEERTKDIVDQGLKRGGRVGETERHDKKFVFPIPGVECCLRNVLFRYTDLPISRREVQRRHMCGFPDLVDAVLD